jgi:predicted RNase H-like HicB family nuclease
VVVHEEDGGYWAEVRELPGCFASGRDLEELKEAVLEAIDLYESDSASGAPKGGKAQLAELLVTT